MSSLNVKYVAVRCAPWQLRSPCFTALGERFDSQVLYHELAYRVVCASAAVARTLRGGPCAKGTLEPQLCATREQDAHRVTPGACGVGVADARRGMTMVSA